MIYAKEKNKAEKGAGEIYHREVRSSLSKNEC
jgi:hypothetical protein